MAPEFINNCNQNSGQWYYARYSYKVEILLKNIIISQESNATFWNGIYSIELTNNYMFALFFISK